MDTVAVPQTISAAFQGKDRAAGDHFSQMWPTRYSTRMMVILFDDVKISEAINRWYRINTDHITTKDGCGLDNNYPVTIKVKNYQCNSKQYTGELPVQWRYLLLQKPFLPLRPTSRWIIPSAPGPTCRHILIIHLIAGLQRREIITKATTTAFVQYSLHSSPVITNYPHSKALNPAMATGSARKQFNLAMGTPSKTNIFKAVMEIKAWLPIYRLLQR